MLHKATGSLQNLGWRDVALPLQYPSSRGLVSSRSCHDRHDITDLIVTIVMIVPLQPGEA